MGDYNSCPSGLLLTPKALNGRKSLESAWNQHLAEADGSSDHGSDDLSRVTQHVRSRAGVQPQEF